MSEGLWMDEQLRWIVELLDGAGIAYWADSGTLLGLVREGKLLEHDRDIDIGVWEHDIAKLSGLTQFFRESNCRIRATKYRGRLYKLKLVPRDESLRKIDITIYQVAMGHAWSPALVPRGVVGRQRIMAALKQRWWAPIQNARMLLHAFLRRLRDFRPGFDMACYPWTRIYQMWTWWIPVDLLKERVFDDNLLVWIPANADKYLRYRYGDWAIPVTDWVYLRDDEGIVHKKPERLIQDSSMG
ncbi:MAG: hypothetical protein GX977_05295 [Firmicutes bacterium]|nr:hypothetical protein [Bacillota bacterium]